MAEDAFISFRVVDNFVNGFGLRWNIDERVQVYTNPLWMLIHIPFYAVTKEIYYTSFFISVVVSAIAISIATKPYRHNPFVLISCFFVPLLASRSFIEYSTSGLENPMTHLLLASFFAVFFKIKKQVPWKTLSLISALAMVNRMDALFFLLPAWFHLLTAHYKNISLKNICIGFTPLILWCVFALLYYGFIFPNTKYAKLNTGLELWDYILQSRYYFIDLLKNHLPSAVIIVAAICITTMGCRKKARPYVWAGWGVVSYIFYICYIGSDHYSGRFWSGVVFLSVIVVINAISETATKHQQNIYCGISLVVITVAILIGIKIQDVQNQTWPSGIENARNIISGLPLSKIRGGIQKTDNFWINKGLLLRDKAAKEGRTMHIIESAAGFLPFHAGPKIIVIDFLAITDPLMSRLPLADKKRWHASHYWRSVPTGYAHARQTGDLSQMNVNLAKYYSILRSITADPIFSIQRLKNIVCFSTGNYDIYLEAYKNSK